VVVLRYSTIKERSDQAASVCLTAPAMAADLGVALMPVKAVFGHTDLDLLPRCGLSNRDDIRSLPGRRRPRRFELQVLGSVNALRGTQPKKIGAAHRSGDFLTHARHCAPENDSSRRGPTTSRLPMPAASLSTKTPTRARSTQCRAAPLPDSRS
jgi:hypothetical protein